MLLLGYYSLFHLYIQFNTNSYVCTDMHKLPNFILDWLLLLRAVTRHGQQIVDVAEDLSLKDTSCCYKQKVPNLFKLMFGLRFFLLCWEPQTNNHSAANII